MTWSLHSSSTKAYGARPGAVVLACAVRRADEQAIDALDGV